MSDTEPTVYLPEPPHTEQELDGAPDLSELLRFGGTPTSSRDWQQVLDWATGQITHRDRVWTGLCQMFCRSAEAIGGGFGTAYEQWQGTPSAAKHQGGDPDAAPTGSMLCSKGTNPAGHIMIAARPFATGTGAAICTDAVRIGWPDRVSRKGLYAAWGHTYLGWIENVNGVWIDVNLPTPQTQHYQSLLAAVDSLDKAINQVRASRDAAKTAQDWKDVDILNNQIALLRERKQKMSDLYNTLRRA